ncbi:MAG: sugar phosphate nucleotidyltransferase [Candidatus Aenigmatarchaeota archaeon]
MIPAAGRGTRLGPITDEKPKPLVEIGQRSLIEHLIDDLRVIGIDQIQVVVGYMRDMIEDRLNSYENVSFIEQEKQLGTAHAIGLSSFKEPFMVVNGDVFIHRQNLIKLKDSFEESTAGAVMGSKAVQNPEEFGVLDVDGKEVEGLVEKPEDPQTNLINTGVYAFRPRIYDYIDMTDRSERGEYEITDSLNMMRDGGHRVIHAPMEKYWIDVGRPEDLERARNISG